MIKNDVIAKVCRETGFSRYIVERIVDTTLDTITESLIDGERVQFKGFGTFEPKKRNARVGRNPHTKEAVLIPARIIPSFKPGKDLTDKVYREIKE